MSAWTVATRVAQSPPEAEAEAAALVAYHSATTVREAAATAFPCVMEGRLSAPVPHRRLSHKPSRRPHHCAQPPPISSTMFDSYLAEHTAIVQAAEVALAAARVAEIAAELAVLYAKEQASIAPVLQPLEFGDPMMSHTLPDPVAC